MRHALHGQDVVPVKFFLLSQRQTNVVLGFLKPTEMRTRFGGVARQRRHTDRNLVCPGQTQGGGLPPQMPRQIAPSAFNANDKFICWLAGLRLGLLPVSYSRIDSCGSRNGLAVFDPVQHRNPAQIGFAHRACRRRILKLMKQGSSRLIPLMCAGKISSLSSSTLPWKLSDRKRAARPPVMPYSRFRASVQVKKPDPVVRLHLARLTQALPGRSKPIRRRTLASSMLPESSCRSPRNISRIWRERMR